MTIVLHGALLLAWCQHYKSCNIWDKNGMDGTLTHNGVEWYSLALDSDTKCDAGWCHVRQPEMQCQLHQIWNQIAQKKAPISQHRTKQFWALIGEALVRPNTECQLILKIALSEWYTTVCHPAPWNTCQWQLYHWKPQLYHGECQHAEHTPERVYTGCTEDNNDILRNMYIRKQHLIEAPHSTLKYSFKCTKRLIYWSIVVQCVKA